MLIGQSFYAQNEYKPAYIITTEQDTIQGYIQFNVDAELSENISFKKNLTDAAVTSYNPSQVVGFNFENGRTFKRMKVSNNNKIAQDSSFVFAKQLVKGKIDLLVWRKDRNNTKDYFVINNDSKRQARLIKPKKTEIKQDGKTYSRKDTKFKNHLAFVKHDLNLESRSYEKLKFSDNSIRKEVIAFNEESQKEFPLTIYKEPYDYTYTILVGSPFEHEQDELRFRLAVYRNKTFVEKTNQFSFLSGVVYHHYSHSRGWDSEKYNSFNGTSNYIWQMLNIIPVGIHFQTNAQQVIPYGHFGVGAAALMMTDYIIEDNINVGDQKEFVFFPTLNVGVGLKIKVKSNYIVTEITPTMNGVFFNAGYAF